MERQRRNAIKVARAAHGQVDINGARSTATRCGGYKQRARSRKRRYGFEEFLESVLQLKPTAAA